MANLLPTITDPDYKNWVKGGLALKFSREGIENFVERNIDNFHQNILKSLPSGNQCCNCSTENIVHCKYNNNFCKFSNNICKVHNRKDPSKKSRPCPNSVCNVFRDEILKKHRFHGPSWKNTDSSRWCVEPWQLATCYMAAGYEALLSATKTDFPGLLAVIINNKHFDTEVTDNLTNKNNVFCKARDARNEILHKADMRLSDAELAGYITTLDAMLSDAKCLAAHPSAIHARALLQQIQNDTLSISTIDEGEVRAEALRALRQTYDQKKKALKEELLSVYQDGEHMFTSLGPVAAEEDKHIEDLYVDPNMKRDGVQVQSYQDIFKVENKKIYIVGEAGMGKTSLCQKIVSTWCKINTKQKGNMCDNQQAVATFDYLFYISLRHVITDDIIDEMIKQQLLPNKQSLYDPLSRVLNEEKCLIILDGLDEWTTENKTAKSAQVNKGLPGRDAVRKCTVLTTTRPWKLESLKLKSSQIDTKVDLLGIDEISKKQLVQNMITHLNDKFHKQKTYEDFITDTHDKKLFKLTSIPVILKQIVCLWHGGKNLGKNKTAIYCQMLELLLELAKDRLDNDSQYLKKKEEWKKLSIKFPSCFDDNETCQDFIPLVVAIAELAFQTLFNNDQESSLVFKSSREGCHNLSSEEENICLKIGILSKDKLLIDCTSRYTKIYFLHKSYQEFLAAIFVSFKPKQCVETFKSFCNSEEKCREMSNVLSFISGTCTSATTCTLLQHYYNMRIFLPIRDNILDCMKEGWTCSHDNKHLYSDFIKIEEPSEYLNQLCKVNIPNIKSLKIVSPPTSQCLQHLQQIHKLKELDIDPQSHSPISEDHLYDLIHHHRHTLKIIRIERMTLRSNTRLSTLIPQVQQLWKLDIWFTTLPQQLLTSLQALHSDRPYRRININKPTILPDTESSD